MSLYNAVEDVATFHVVTETPIGEIPAWPSDARIELRVDLIKEEVIHELLPAISRLDLVETADAIVDSIYVLIGAALEFGIPVGSVWAAVQTANMSKAVEDEDGKRRVIRRDDGKILKPEGWTPPDIREILLAAGWVPTEERNRPEIYVQDRMDWLERSLKVLGRHYGSSIEILYPLSSGVRLSLVRGKCIGQSDTLALAVEDAIARLTDAEILAADALVPT